MPKIFKGLPPILIWIALCGKLTFCKNLKKLSLVNQIMQLSKVFLVNTNDNATADSTKLEQFFFKSFFPWGKKAGFQVHLQIANFWSDPKLTVLQATQ